MRHNYSVLLIAVAVFAANNLVNNGPSDIKVKSSSAPITSQVGDRTIAMDDGGRVLWQHEGSLEHVITLDENIVKNTTHLAKLLRTSGAVELTAPLQTYRSTRKANQSPRNQASKSEVIVEYSITSFHGKLIVSIWGDGTVRVTGKNWDGVIDKHIGTLSAEHTAAIDFYARQFSAKPLTEIEPARSGGAYADGSTIQVMTYPGTANAVQVYLEREDGSVWHGGLAGEEQGRFLLLDLTRKLLEFEDYAPNKSHSVSSI